MANKNLIALIEYAAKTMEADFENSKELFKADKRNRIFHAAEFGAYRERIVSKFLRLILPPNYEIGSGFIITPEGDISSQCDVIIYDRDETTVFNDPQHSRLFPIETVIVACSVKLDH